MVNVKLGYGVMHLVRLREAYRLSLIALQVRAKVQVVALNTLRRLFTYPMALHWQQLLIRLPFVGAVAQHLAAVELLQQTLASRIGAPAGLPADHLFARRLKAVPQPVLISFLANKRPHFVNLQVGKARRRARFSDLCGSLFDSLEHGVDADSKHPRDVADAGAVDGHWYDHLANFRPTALIRVVGQELAEAVITAEALLALLTSAILFNSQRAAPGTGDSFVLHIQSLP